VRSFVPRAGSFGQRGSSSHFGESCHESAQKRTSGALGHAQPLSSSSILLRESVFSASRAIAILSTSDQLASIMSLAVIQSHFKRASAASVDEDRGAAIPSAFRSSEKL
jgi:hypothetical protein